MLNVQNTCKRIQCIPITTNGKKRLRYLKYGKLVVDEQGEQDGGTDEELDPEGVVVVVVGRLELQVDQVDGGVRGGEEDYLHQRVVQGDVRGHQVQVAGRVDYRKQYLRFARDACNEKDIFG